MNLRAQRTIPSGERGSTLLVAMCFTLVLAVALASYQTACYYTLKTGSRNEQSIRSRQLAEAGLEEALYALTNRNFTGWTITGGVYTKSLTGFTYESAQVTGTVNLTITGYDDTNRSTTKPTITSVGVIQNTDGTIMSRTLTASTGYSSTATTGRAPIFANALAADATSGTVNLTSGGVLVDSYNSFPDTRSGYTTTQYLYNASVPNPTGSGTFANTGYSAVVTASSVTLANGAQVKGYVATAPSSNAVVLSSGTTSKLTGPSTSGSVKIDTTRESTSPYQLSPTVSPPSFGAPLTLVEPSSTVHLGTAGGSITPYLATLGGTPGWAGWYYLSSGTLEIDGPVVITIPGNLYINGSGSIVIKPGGSLQILIAGSTYIYYNGIDNQTHLPANLAIISTATSASSNYTVGIWTPTPFYGTVYAPYCSITVWGYSSASAIYGALVGYTLTVYPYSSTSMPIHYDVALRNTVLSGLGDNVPFAVSNVTDSSL